MTKPLYFFYEIEPIARRAMEIIEDPSNPWKSIQMMWEEAVLGSPRKAWEGLVSY